MFDVRNIMLGQQLIYHWKPRYPIISLFYSMNIMKNVHCNWLRWLPSSPDSAVPPKVAIIKISQERGYDKRVSPGGSELGRVLMAMEADGNLQGMMKTFIVHSFLDDGKIYRKRLYLMVKTMVSG